ncbi:TetR/AcrR family transcriptional regulator [Virgibacillus siamensis]|uniref:TetR/AcrR family transcriptional regulator n=1 Tax=Virgibacillus siamensis TaxID=480071 RepID=UPI0009856813|nr:TetR family transcriptional regulator C-terminal domain-containing protein [Virgibacillus siamensis]
MPKKVDHTKRKILIAEATWNVIIRDGLEKATVREVAKEAGLSAGALRHYFSTQSELLAFSMELVSDRVRDRALSKKYTGPPMDVMLELLGEFLPIDDERRVEMEVWLVFSSRTLIDKKLHALSQEVYTDMKQAVQHVIEGLIQLGFAKTDIDKEIETRKLHALIDGIALHALLHPNEYSVETMLETVRSHLKSLCMKEEKA